MTRKTGSSTSKSDRTRAQILDAAAQVLADRGYGGTSLNYVAEQIGMRGASLYYHFSSKDELVLEVLRQGTLNAREAVADAIIKLGEDPDPAECLRVAIVAHLCAVLAQGPYTTANIRNYGQLPDRLAQQHRDDQRSYGETWRDLISNGVRSGAFRPDPNERAARLLILGAMNWSIEWFDEDDDLSAEELGNELADMVLGGLIRNNSLASET